MAERGVVLMATGKGTLNEEIPEAYKSIDQVVEVVHQVGISKKVARLRSVGCIKGCADEATPTGALWCDEEEYNNTKGTTW